MESVLIDYIPKRKFKKAGPASMWALKIATGLSVWGVYEFNTNDIGTLHAVGRWSETLMPSFRIDRTHQADLESLSVAFRHVFSLVQSSCHSARPRPQALHIQAMFISAKVHSLHF
jgi:hypothetical protein